MPHGRKGKRKEGKEKEEKERGWNEE